MRIRIFDNAKFDLADGYDFYGLKADGLGAYFLDSLYSDINSLILFAGVHRVRVRFDLGICRHGLSAGSA